jgi:hypothetical protein
MATAGWNREPVVPDRGGGRRSWAFRAFVMTPATSSARRINRGLSPIGVNLPVSKFLIPLKPLLTASGIPACDEPRRALLLHVAARKRRYSISSSTRATNDGDNVMPSARAV